MYKSHDLKLKIRYWTHYRTMKHFVIMIDVIVTCIHNLKALASILPAYHFATKGRRMNMDNHCCVAEVAMVSGVHAPLRILLLFFAPIIRFLKQQNKSLSIETWT